MKVTIEGDLDQVTEALLPQKKAAPTRQTIIREKAARRAALTDKRRLVRRAFEKVRYSEDDRAASEILLKALTRGMTEEALTTARLLLAEEALS